MAKKNEYLGRHERKRYSRLVSERLETLGVQDGIIPQKLGRRKYVDPTGKVLFEGDVIKLTNPHRNLVRRLRRMPRKVVEAFLKTELKGDAGT